MQLKYIDDVSQIASINLKKSLIQDQELRPRPLNYHERTEMILNPEHNVNQDKLDKFHQFTQSNKLVINQNKIT